MLSENMDIWVALGAGLAIGIICGIALTCLLAAAGRTSRSTEYLEDERE